jgi:hypothetical protein
VPTIPTGALERELRKLYLQWLAGVPKHEADTDAYLGVFEKKSRALITRMGGQVASLGALAGFPVPKTLELSPRAGVIYDEMKQAAISAGITAGLNSKDVARQMLNAGLDKNYRKLERLARTETVSAYWKNGWDSIADLPLLVMVWGAENGHRTCDYCLSRDGLVIEDGNIRDHPNGRCTPIPTLRSQVKYKGTLQPDGSVTMDPAWADQKVKGAKPKDSAGPTTEAQRDPLSGKSNPAAPSKAQPAQQVKPSETPVKSVADIGADLKKNLAGTGIQVEGFTNASTLRPEVVKKFTDTVSSLVNEFPALKGMKAIRIAPSNVKDSMAFASFNRQSTSVRGAGINLNSKFSGSYSKTVSESIKHGHFHARPDVDPIEYITTHEMGHLLDLATGKRARNQVKRIIAKNGGDVSLYAQVSPAEALAEAFATVRTSAELATPAEKALVEYLLQLLAKAGP